MLDLAVAICRALDVGEPRGDIADALAFVANALQIGDGLDRRHHHAQVAGRGGAGGENAAALLVDGDFHAVDLVILAGHRLPERTVAVDQRGQRLAELLLDEPAHRQHLGADTLQVFVEAAGGMVR